LQKNYFKYLNFSSFEVRWGMYVTSVGYSKVDPNDNYPNQEHPQSHQLTWNRGRILNDYYIIFISNGKDLYGGALTDSYEVVAGTCFFLYPGVLHRYKPDPKIRWEEYWVGFNGSYVEKLMSEGFFDRQNPFVYLGPNKDILILFRALLEAVQTSLPGYHQQIAGVTMQILGLINNISKHHDNINNRAEKLIAKAKYIIQESFETNLNMEELAKELPMGYSSFRKLFKKATGESPNRYHLNLRMERAKNLLSTTQLNVTEVAEQTGFESVFYFSKLFKKKHGMSPKNFQITEENIIDDQSTDGAPKPQ